MGNLASVTDADFRAEVLEHVGPVLVDFWASWCGPCRALAPVLEQIAAEQAGLKIVKLDVDANPATSREYRIGSIPTLLLFRGGQVVKTMVGAKPKVALLSDLADYLH